jgi:hypothetical protein
MTPPSKPVPEDEQRIDEILLELLPPAIAIQTNAGDPNKLKRDKAKQAILTELQKARIEVAERIKQDLKSCTGAADRAGVEHVDSYLAHLKANSKETE